MKDYYFIMDKILKTLYENENKIDIGDHLSINLSANNYGLNNTEIAEVWSKLERDNYIYEYTKNSGHRINLEGMIFIQNGGYTQQQKDLKLERTKTTIFNLAVGIGTGLAGLYALVQFLLFLWQHFYQCNCQSH